MQFRPRLALSIALCATALSGFAASVVGTWHGRLDMSAMKLPPASTPQQKEMFQKFRTSMATTKFTFTFKADKSYVSTMAGGPVKKPINRTGTWTQSGNTVSTKGEKSTETMTLSADGKTLTAIPKRGNGLKVIFTRA